MRATCFKDRQWDLQEEMAEKDLQEEKEFQVEMGERDGMGSQDVEVPLDHLVMQVMMEVTVSQVETAVMDSQAEMA